MPPPTRAIAIMVITGRPTAVIKKPAAANQTCLAGLQDRHWRKNDIAGAEKQRKGHKAQREDVFGG